MFSRMKNVLLPASSLTYSRFFTTAARTPLNKRLFAVVGDTGGTFADPACTSPGCATHDAFEKEGVNLPRELIHRCMGMEKAAHIKKLTECELFRYQFAKHHRREYSFEKDFKRIFNNFNDKQNELLKNVVIIPHAIGALKFLHRQQIPFAFTTSFHRAATQIVLNKLASSLPFKLPLAISADEIPKGTRANLVKEALERHNISSLNYKRTVFITDTESDIRSVKNDSETQSITTIGVSGFAAGMNLEHPDELNTTPKEILDEKRRRVERQLLDAGADSVITYLDELPRALYDISEELDQQRGVLSQRVLTFPTFRR